MRVNSWFNLKNNERVEKEFRNGNEDLKESKSLRKSMDTKCTKRRDERDWTAVKIFTINIRKLEEELPIREQSKPLREFKASNHQMRSQFKDKDCLLCILDTTLSQSRQ